MRHGDEMDMIGHEAICPYFQAMELRILPQQFQLTEIIAIGKKYLLPVIPPLGEMVGNIDKDFTRAPWHEKYSTVK
jgi:hypothetical protein